MAYLREYEQYAHHQNELIQSLDKVMGVTYTSYLGVSIKHLSHGFEVLSIKVDTLEQAKKIIIAAFEKIDKSIK